MPQEAFFITAGIIGVVVSVIHGVPILAGNDVPVRGRRIFPILMHFSTAVWFLAGGALVMASLYLTTSITMVIACVAALLYALGAVGNFWGTRGRHFGWILLAFAVALIMWALFV